MGVGASPCKMKVLLALSILPSLVLAHLSQAFLEVHESGVAYNQTVIFDFDNQIQIIDVPSHHNLVHARVIFDFNKGKLVESHPASRLCYLKPIPVGTPSMQRFSDLLTNKWTKAAGTAGTVPKIQKYFAATRQRDSTVLQDSFAMLDECRGSRIFEVREVNSSIRSTASSGPAPVELSRHLRSRGDGKCPFPNKCIWQPCKVGKDSCYWIANCPMGDLYCEDMIHNSNFHTNGDPVSCDVCFNTKCGNDCQSAWDACKDSGGDLVDEMTECSQDVDVGRDCDRESCQWPSDEKYLGVVECKQDSVEDGRVLAGNMCTLTCYNKRPGGYIQCMEDGTYMDKTWCDPPTQFHDC